RRSHGPGRAQGEPAVPPAGQSGEQNDRGGAARATGLAHRGVGVALAVAVLGRLGGGALEADAVLVEDLDEDPAVLGLLLHDGLDLLGGLEGAADDLELPGAVE